MVFNPWWERPKKNYQVHRQKFILNPLDFAGELLCGQPLYRTVVHINYAGTGPSKPPEQQRMPTDDLVGIGEVTCKNCLKILGKRYEDRVEEVAVPKDHDYNALNHAANLDKLCNHTLTQFGKISDMEELRAANRAYAIALLKRLDVVALGIDGQIQRLRHTVTKAAVGGVFNVMTQHREEAGRLFEMLGKINQTNPSSANAYCIYLLAGVFNDPNQKPASYAIVEAIRWADKAGVTIENMANIGNLLFD